MKRLLSVLAATTILAGCATTAPVETAEVAPVAAAEPVPAAAPAPKAEIGAYGFDAAGMDTAVQPGDNFFEYASGTWAKNTPIPADKSGYGMFTVLDDLSKQRTRGLIEEAAKDPNSRIGAVYASFMDQAAIDAKGLAPIKPWLDTIKGTTSRAALPTLFAEAAKNGVRTPFAAYVGQDDKAPENYILSMGQSGIGLPDRDYYLKDDAKLADIRAKYVAHLTNVMTLAGEPNAAARAQAILAFETEIAKVHWTRVDSRDATKTYNKFTVAQLAKTAPGFDFSRMFAAAGANGVNELLVAQPSAITGIARILARAPMSVIRDQLLVRSLDGYAAVLPSAFDKENFAFFGTTLSGTPEQEARWKRAVSFTTGTLQDDVSKLYVAKYFPPETKAAADELVKNVVEAMGRRIDGLTWMAPATKARARAKLANFNTKIGYPSQWRDMSGLAVAGDDAFGNALRSRRFEYAYDINKLGKPIYKWEWGMTPMTINAYANFSMSEIVFPAAILQPPFFDPNADPALNYGGIGAVIGHEISHHFDDQGSKYDEYGRLADWWTADDLKAFNAATAQLVAQYNAYEPLPGQHVNGQLTLGENIGDLAGLTVAYDAYKHSLGGAAAPVLDGTTGDQRFYLGWAQVWRNKLREPALRQRLLTDPHSPAEQRVSVVRNLDPWYNAFNVQAGQKLYLAPAQRVRVW
ncbi:M13 family metallopeptidase [Sphingomonas astaxanthinifaciens]|uniref:Peptidase M13 n=1 Tax=Sphingomonas astaxanthinifaciens DSM 22298 TaxID=1123267 RepID=A0ABQ5Z7K1_9SPHN|nr:M13 family metallopeptidase [Sphingomonas astaxanthinifaciens]GLR48764.1 peptidase M13 [Sphingomonas astaxanthinifaciens DSM 22298]